MAQRDIDAIFAGHDAGAYALPGPVLEDRGRLAALVAHRQARHAEREAAEAAARQAPGEQAARLLGLAAAGRPLPADLGAAVVAARGRRELLAQEVAVAGEAVRLAENALARTLAAEHDRIAGYLHAAVQEVAAAVQATAPALAGADLSDAAAIVRSPARSAAFSALLEAHERYEAIRRAQLGAWRAAGNEGRLPPQAEARDAGQSRTAGLTGARRLLALVRGGAALWVPTAAQLAAARRRQPGETVHVPGLEAGPGQPLNDRRSMRGRRALPAPAGAEA